MFQTLLVIHVILTLAMIVIILLQRNASDGLGGIGGGGGSGFISSRSQANLLTRTTAILATFFIINSLALSWLSQHDMRRASLVDKIAAEEAAEANTPQVPKPDSENGAKEVEKKKPSTPSVPKPEAE
jgi:preprotein translocase subunit SecG